MEHNHITRDIKPPGVCPGCDRHHPDSDVIAALKLENEALREKIKTILDITLPPVRTEDNDRTN